MGTPTWKVYRGKEYVAACKYPEDAAALMFSDGDCVKFDHKVLVWCEGNEAFPAAQSYDKAGDVMRQRRFDAHKAGLERYRENQERYKREMAD